ncbi:WD40-repeat-containing domain protein [Xylaria sp. FL1777]|nr:WD40-repeat-containing domain protein [Xylaria sp. FL1777]
MTSNNASTNPEPEPNLLESLTRFCEKLKRPVSRTKTKTWNRENKPTSPPTSSNAGPIERTSLAIPSTTVEVVPSSSCQTPLDDDHKPRNIASDGLTQGVMELFDTKSHAPQATPELEAAARATVLMEGTDKSKKIHDSATSQDDALLLLWTEAYDALLYDDVPKLPPSDWVLLRRELRWLRRLGNRYISRRVEFDTTNPVARMDEMQRILESLLTEPGLVEDKAGVDRNSETEPTSFSKFRDIVRDVALQETQRGAAVAWVAVCKAADALMNMSDSVSLKSSQYLINIITAMEWYCSLPGLLLGQPASQNQETRMAILELYKAIILCSIRLPYFSTEENVKFPDDIVEKERAVMACFGQPSLQSRLNQPFKSLSLNTEDEHIKNELPASYIAPSLPEGLSYSFRNELSEVPEERRGIQDCAHDWVKSTEVYAKFSSPDAPDYHCELWIVGKPGTGKSILLEAIAQDLFQCQDIDVKLGTEPLPAYVAAFFCNRGRERAENAAAILQCLVLQVLEQQTWLRRHFLAAYDTAEKRCFDRPEDLHVISSVFRAILDDSSFKPTYFVINAIDECCNDEDEDETNQAVWALMDFISSTRQVTGVRWLISADSDGAKKRSFPRTDGADQKLELYLDGDSISPATEPVMLGATVEHIKLRVAGVMKDMQIPDSFHKEVEYKMLEQSKGNFLWVDTACKQILSHGLPWNAIRFLDSDSNSNEVLPSGLEPLYTHMEATLDKLQWESPRYCREIINTLATAYKPLRLDELGECLPKDTIPRNVDLATIIRRQCFAFLEIRDDQVFFVHRSAKYFFRKKMKGTSQRHADMTLCCLRALSERMGNSVRGRHNKAKEVNHYSTWYWLKHLRKIDGKWLETLTPSSVLTQILIQLFDLERILQEWPGESNDKVKRCLDRVRSSSRFIQFHTYTQSPPHVSPNNSLLFCSSLGAGRGELLHTALPWLSSIPNVETSTSLVIHGHTDWVRSCAFSNDGRLLASASDDETIRFWDPLTGTSQATLKGFDSWPRRVRFSAGSPSRMATMESAKVKLWSIPVSRSFLSIQGSDIGDNFETASILDICFSPDGKRLAVVVEPGELAIWNVEKPEKQPIRHWPGHGATRVRYLAAGGTSNNNQESGATGATQGGLLATSCGSEGAYLVIWSESGQEIHRQKFDNGLCALAFCPLSNILAAGSYDEVFLWRVNLNDKNKKIEKLALQPKIFSKIVSLAISEDGSFLGVASRDKIVRIWKLHDEADQKPLEVTTRHLYGPLEISFLSKNSLSSIASCGREGLIEITDLNSQKSPTAITKVPMHSYPINIVVISPNNRFLATSSIEGVICLWNGDTGDHIRTLENGDSLLSPVFSHDGVALAGTFSSGVAKVWGTITGEMTHENLEHDDWVRGSAFSPPCVDNLLLATASDDGIIRVWNVDTQVPKNNKDNAPAPLQVFKRHSDYAICVAFSPDGRLIASAGDDRVVYLWDRTTTDPEGSPNTRPKESFNFAASRIESVTFSPDGKRVAASSSHELRIWDCESGSCMVRKQPQSFKSLRFSGVPSVDERWILTERGPEPVGDSDSMIMLPLTETWPALASWSVDSDGKWIKFKGKEVIFLPQGYRPNGDAVFVQGSRVAIGCRSGLVMLLRFSEDEELLEQHFGVP